MYGFYELILNYYYTGKIYSHGFFKGKFLPIYGIGSVLIILLLDKYKNNNLKFLVMAFFLTGLFEYISGVFLLKIFKIRLWDYTNRFLNINGHVCFLSALCFSLGGELVIKIIYPLINKIDTKYLNIFLIFLFFLFQKCNCNIK